MRTADPWDFAQEGSLPDSGRRQSEARKTEQAPEALVAACHAAGEAVRVPRGLLLIAAGARSDEVFLLLAGRLRVTLFSADGREVIIRDSAPGQFVGDLAALDGVARSATIVALDDSSVLRLSAAAFRAAVTERPEAALWYQQMLARRLRDLTDRLFEMSTLNVRSRLHAQLLRLSAEAGLEGGVAALEPAPTHEHLATLIGTHREAVTRELSYLASVGVVERGRGRLVVRDVARLSAMVGKALGAIDRYPIPAGLDRGLPPST